MESINVYDAMIKFVVKIGIYSNFLLIVAAVLPSFECRNNNIQTTRLLSVDSKTFSFQSSVKTSIITGIVFTATQTILCFICFLFASQIIPYSGLGYGTFGAFGYIRTENPFVYLLICQINYFLYGCSINLFARCLLKIIQKKQCVVPAILIYSCSYMFVPLPTKDTAYFKWMVLFAPQLLGDLLTYDIPVFNRTFGYVSIFLSSYVLHGLSIRINMNRRKRLCGKEHP